MKKLRAMMIVCALLVCFAVALGGCTTKTTGPEDVEYPDQSTPESVLEKLEMVYEAMDTAGYMECLAEDFVFVLNPDDVTADPPLPEYWHKAEERTAHENLFGDGRAVDDVSLMLTVVSVDSLPGEDLWEYDTHFDLRIESGFDFYTTGRVVFVMGQAPGRARTTWQIVEQHDLIQTQGWAQELSLTGVKLTFGGMNQEPLYPIRSSPANTILKLRLAYERMDAEAYLDCLAEDLLFYLNPEDVGGELPEYWDKAEETTIHENMFGVDTNVTGVTLVFTHDTDSHDPGDPGDPLDDLWTYREDYDLRVQLPPDLTLHAVSPSDFVLQVDPDETGHGGMLLWEIVEWYDLPYEWRSGPSTEDASWGSIKAMYR